MERFTPLDYLRSLAEAFEYKSWKSKVLKMTQFLRLTSGLPKLDIEPPVPRGVELWASRKDSVAKDRSKLMRASKRLLHNLGETDSESES